MIIDKLENVLKYESIIPNDAIEFLRNLSPDLKTGRYELNYSNYVNVDEYIPKSYEDCFFEAHKKYIDIQMVLSGEENLEYTMADELKLKESYDD